MENKTTAHIISHTHWDREWFLTSRYTNEWLIPLFDSLFDLIEKEPEYIFVLDGQTLLVEDYFKELIAEGRDKEKYEAKLKKYVSEKRLFFGPYYLQPDWQLVSDESLVRNLLIGHRMANDLGRCMETGWLLDNFGQISQAVQIHRGFGKIGLYVWRGIEMDPMDIKSEFIWESPDGSALTTVFLINSYRNAICLTGYPDIMEDRIVKETEKLKPFATTCNILLMNGYDQQIIPDNIQPGIRAINRKDIVVKQSSPEELIAAIERFKPELRKIKDYLYSGRFISIFPGTLSSRMYLKLMNDNCQRMLERYTEPVSSLSWIMGSDYKQEKIDAVWRLLLKNHPHDNICGVCIDDVHTDMEKRFEKTYHRAKNLMEDELKKLTAIIDTSKGKNKGETYIIFNTSLIPRESVITIKPEKDKFIATDSNGDPIPSQKGINGTLHMLVKDIPAYGYKTIYLGSSTQKSSLGINQIEIDEKNRIVENNYLRVQIKDDGSLGVFDKINRVSYQGLGVFEDGADAGDTYSHSPIPHNRIFLSSGKSAGIDFLEKGPLICTIRLRREMSLPEKLTENRKARYEKRKTLPVITVITIDAAYPLIRFKTWVKNTVKDHRFRVLFPTGLKTVKSYAETQFDVVEHDIYPEPYDESKIPENVKRMFIGARELEPITTFPQRSFVDLTDGKVGVAVINRGLPEYEVIKNNNTLALTLFRSIGWLAWDDLFGRIGDAGPVIYTPDAQCLREMEFNYALYFHQGDWRVGRVPQYADFFNSDCIVVKTDVHKGSVPDEKEFIKLESAENILKVTAIKRSEDGDGLIIRCYNPAAKEINGILSSSVNIISSYYTDLNEAIKKKITNTRKNIIRFKAHPKEIVTLKFLLQRSESVTKDAVSANIIKVEQYHSKPDFSSYTSISVITSEDIAKEEQRVNKITDKIESALNREKKVETELKKCNKVDRVKIEAELHRTKGDIKTYKRALLEAQLSVILSKKKFNDLYPEKKLYEIKLEEIDTIFKDLGYKMNKARINKRTYDYLVDYYNQKAIGR